MNWIKLTDRLPELDVEILIFSPAYTGGYLTVATRSKNGDADWYEDTTEGLRIEGITHWMPVDRPTE